MKLLFTNTCKLNHDDLRKLEHQNTILTVMQREGQNTLSHSDVTKKGLMSHPTPSFFAVNRRPGTVSECARFQLSLAGVAANSRQRQIFRESCD